MALRLFAITALAILLPSVADVVSLNNDGKKISGRDKQRQFVRLVSVADRLFAETQSEGAALNIIRAAFQVCDTCKTTTSPGHFSEKIFEFEDFTDRRFLSEYIVPAVISTMPKRVLWVGVQPYTLRTLYQMENSGIEVSTIEPWDGMSQFGSSKHHMVSGIGDLGRHVRPATYDIIIINGVIGWGLDDERMIKDAVKVMHTHLKKDGVLVVGHNKLPNRGSCCGYFLPFFSPYAFGGLPAIHEDPNSETKHVFEFFIKRNV